MLTAASNTSFTPISVIANSSDVSPSAGSAPMINPTVEQKVLDCWVDMEIILAGDRPSVLDSLKNNCFMDRIRKLQFDDIRLTQLKEKPVNTLSMKEIVEMYERKKTMSKKDKAMHKWSELYKGLQLKLWSEEPVDNEQREAARSKIKKQLDDVSSNSMKQPVSDLFKSSSKYSLTLSGFNLRSIPEPFLVGVSEFSYSTLTALDISNNNLSVLNVLPQKLEILNASGNQFYTIPTAITELDHIESLDLSNNNLHTLFLDPYYTTGIKQNTFPNSLRLLNISGNPELERLDYQALPSELIKLDVSGCSINEIELTLMPEKVTIICNGNTTLLVKGEKFTGEKWNGMAVAV